MCSVYVDAYIYTYIYICPERTCSDFQAYVYVYIVRMFLCVQARFLHSLPTASYVPFIGHKVAQTSYTSTQEFVEALMMGTHARLGAHSPVLLLDPDLAVSIAQMIIADRW